MMSMNVYDINDLWSLFSANWTKSQSYPKARLLFDPLDQVRIIGCHLFTSCRSSLCKKKNRPRHQLDADFFTLELLRQKVLQWRNPAQSRGSKKTSKNDSFFWTGIWGGFLRMFGILYDHYESLGQNMPQKTTTANWNSNLVLDWMIFCDFGW